MTEAYNTFKQDTLNGLYKDKASILFYPWGNFVKNFYLNNISTPLSQPNPYLTITNLAAGSTNTVLYTAMGDFGGGVTEKRTYSLNIYTLPGSVTNLSLASATLNTAYFTFTSVPASYFNISSVLGQISKPYAPGTMGFSLTGSKGVYNVSVVAGSNDLSALSPDTSFGKGYILGYNFYPAPIVTTVGTANSVTSKISWNYGAYPEYISNMSLTYYPTAGGGTTVSTSFGNTVSEIILDSLNPSTTYSAYVQTFFQTDNSLYSSSQNTFSFYTSPEFFAPTVTLQSFVESQQTTDSLNLLWAPTQANVSISYYEIGGTTTSVGFDKNITQTTLPNLQPATTYNINAKSYKNNITLSYNTRFITKPLPAPTLYVYDNQIDWNWQTATTYVSYSSNLNFNYEYAFINQTRPYYATVPDRTFSANNLTDASSKILKLDFWPYTSQNFTNKILLNVKYGSNSNLSNNWFTFSNQSTVTVDNSPIWPRGNTIQLPAISLQSPQTGGTSISLPINLRADGAGLQAGVTGYSITYQPFGGDTQTMFVPSSAATISNLVPVTQYSITAQTIFKYYQTTFTSAITNGPIMTTLPPLMDLYVYDKKATSIYVSWTEIPGVSGYTISCNGTNGNTLQINPGTSTASFTKLIANTQYLLFYRGQVINYDRYGTPFTNSGAFGKTLTVTTIPDTINPPPITLQSFDEAQQSLNSLNIIWDRTSIPLVSNYSITYGKVGTTPSKISVPGTSSKTTLESLDPGAPYTIQGQAFYNLLSSTVYTTTFTPLPDFTPLYVTEAQPYSLTMGFSELPLLSAPSFYVVKAHAPFMQTVSNSVQVGTDTTTFTLPHADSQYTFSVKACVQNTDLTGKININCGQTYTTFASTTPIGPPPEMDMPIISFDGIDNLIPLSPVSMKLRWLPAQKSDGYSITFNNIKTGTTDTTLTINSLQPGTEYSVQGQTFYYQDPRVYTSSLFLADYVTIPSPMLDLYQFGATTDSMAFSFTKLSANPNLAGYELTLLTNSNVYQTYSMDPTQSEFTASGIYPGKYQAQIQGYVINTDPDSNIYYNYGLVYSIAAATKVNLVPPTISLVSFKDEDQSTSSLNLGWTQVAFADFLSISVEPAAGGDVIQCPVQVTDETFLQSNLNAGTKYLIKGQSFRNMNRLVQSSSLFTTTLTTLPEKMPDLFPVAATKNSLKISFSTLTNNPDIKGYKVEIENLYVTTNSKFFPPISKFMLRNPQPLLQTNNLKITTFTTNNTITFSPIPNGTYQPQVSAYVENVDLTGQTITNAGEPFIPNLGPIETTPDLVAPRISNDTSPKNKDSIALSWDPTIVPFPTPYLSMTALGPGLNEIFKLNRADIDAGIFTFRYLNPGTRYTFTAQTFYEQNNILYSSSLFANTISTNPDAMLGLVQIGSTSNNVVLRYDTLSANPNVDVYKISLFQNGVGVVNTTTNNNSKIATVSGLQPLSEYEASIEACVYNKDLTNQQRLDCGDAFRGLSVRTDDVKLETAESEGLSDFARIGICIGVIAALWIIYIYMYKM